MKFVESPNMTKGRKRKLRVIVMHTMQAPEGPSTAENVAAYFAKPSAKASAHYCVDNDTEVGCVLDGDTAWHCSSTGNSISIGVELAGRAEQSAGDWQDVYSQSMLERAARLVADKCKWYGIPIVRLNAQQLRDGAAGICGHKDISDAWNETNHWDPGPNFPWDQFLTKVRAAAGPVARQAPIPPTIIETNRAENMKRLEVNCRLDSGGNGWMSIDAAAEKVVSVTAQGPHPPADGYWEIPLFSIQNRDTAAAGPQTTVTITEGRPNGHCRFWVWIAD
jgi:hypothetical protein